MCHIYFLYAVVFPCVSVLKIIIMEVFINVNKSDSTKGFTINITGIILYPWYRDKVLF